MAYSFIPKNASATASAAPMAISIPALAGMYSYLASFSISGGGATAALVIVATITGVDGAPLSFNVGVPAGATNSINPPVIVAFDMPLQSSALNTAITLNVPSFGAGNTVAACTIQGFQSG